jgi:hypothetical protein
MILPLLVSVLENEEDRRKVSLLSQDLAHRTARRSNEVMQMCWSEDNP